MSTIDSAEVPERFAQEGFVSPIDVYDESEMVQIRADFAVLEAAEGRESSVIGLQGRHLDQRFVWNIATNPRVLDIVAATAGEDLLLMSTHFFNKYPGGADGHFVAWHQDTRYWGLAPDDAVTAWLAVDESDVENGCMQVIPASHVGHLKEHGTSTRPNNLLATNQAIPDEELDVASAVPLELRAGQISLHHGRTVHGSLPNRSARRRCGLTLRYITPGVRQVRANNRGGWWKPILVRGEDRFGHFPPLDPPFS